VNYISIIKDYKMRIEKKPICIRCLAVIGLVYIGFSNAGCKYDQPLLPTACDTAIVTFSGVVKPILEANCTRCHVGPNAINGNGIRLDDYAYVIMQVPQPMLDAINHKGNVTPMPKDANKLDACNIAKIKKWIASGAPNN
jgi:hypothetical protein